MVKIEKKQPMAEVTVQKGKEPETHESIKVGAAKLGLTGGKVEKVGDVMQVLPMANVGVKVGMTKNLGNYESLRVDVSLYMPCDPDDQSMHDTFDLVQNWCDLKMQSIMEELE